MVPVISAGEKFLKVKKDSAELKLLAGSNATFYRDGRVKLVCKARGYPLPTITWLKNDEVIDKEFDIIGISVQNNSLVMTNVSWETAAYTCVARNRFGTVNVTSFIKYEGKIIAVINPLPT